MPCAGILVAFTDRAGATARCRHLRPKAGKDQMAQSKTDSSNAGPRPGADKQPLTRRDLLRGAATGMVALAIGSGLKGTQPAKAPNIVFFLEIGRAHV